MTKQISTGALVLGCAVGTYHLYTRREKFSLWFWVNVEGYADEFLEFLGGRGSFWSS